MLEQRDERLEQRRVARVHERERHLHHLLAVGQDVEAQEQVDQLEGLRGDAGVDILGQLEEAADEAPGEVLEGLEVVLGRLVDGHELLDRRGAHERRRVVAHPAEVLEVLVVEVGGLVQDHAPTEAVRTAEPDVEEGVAEAGQEDGLVDRLHQVFELGLLLLDVLDVLRHLGVHAAGLLLLARLLARLAVVLGVELHEQLDQLAQRLHAKLGARVAHAAVPRGGHDLEHRDHAREEEAVVDHLVLDLLDQRAPERDDRLLALLARLLVGQGVGLLEGALLLGELDELLERLLCDQLVERVLALL